MPHPDVSGEWELQQSDGRVTRFIALNLVDDGGQLSGDANYLDPAIHSDIFGIGDAGDPFTGAHSMQMEGAVDERFFTLTISWNNGARGEYEGAFQQNGTLAGTAVDLEHPESKATWTTEKAFTTPEPTVVAVAVPEDDGIIDAPPIVVAPPAEADGIIDAPPPYL